MEKVKLRYEVDGDDFTSAGEASAATKRALRQLGFDSELIRRVAICMYEGEINMVIHAEGGVAEVLVDEDGIEILLTDRGPGIPDIQKAMQEGFSTATQNVRELGFGAGMGLPNMKRYSDEIDVQTELGVGTTVRMKVKTT